MNISEAAQSSGLSSKTIRYYEQIELIESAQRDTNGYRIFNESSLAELRFIHRARGVGFSVEECRQLLSIYRNPHRQSTHVKQLVLEKCQRIDERIGELQSMNSILRDLASQCSGDEGPECAILEGLVGEGVQK